MAKDRLTQDQINALFERGDGTIDDVLSNVDGFQNYDFNRPDKFNLENIRSLQSIANVFSRGFSQIMSASLRVPINFKLSRENAIEQIPYASEYIEKMVKDYYAFCIIDLGERNLGMIIVEIDLALAISIHRNLLGAGKEFVIEDERKPLTEIEKITMEEWVQDKVFPQLEEAFQNVAHFDLRLANIETDPQYVKITRPTDMIALIALDVEVGSQEEKEKKVKEAGIRICIPYLSIEPIMDKLTTENANEYRLDKEEGNQETIIKKHLELIKKKIDIELGKNEISLKELLALSEGDVLPLEKKISEDLIGYIMEKPKFSCLPGKKGNKVAVKIKNFAKKGE